jgi:hypothetical protein
MVVDLLVMDANMSMEEASNVNPIDIDFNQGIIVLPYQEGKVFYITTKRLLLGLVDMVKMFRHYNWQPSKRMEGA